MMSHINLALSVPDPCWSRKRHNSPGAPGGPTAAHSTSARALLLTLQPAGCLLLFTGNEENCVFPGDFCTSCVISVCLSLPPPIWQASVPCGQHCTKWACEKRTLGLGLQLWDVWEYFCRKLQARQNTTPSNHRMVEFGRHIWGWSSLVEPSAQKVFQ